MAKDPPVAKGADSESQNSVKLSYRKSGVHYMVSVLFQCDVRSHNFGKFVRLSETMAR